MGHSATVRTARLQRRFLSLIERGLEHRVAYTLEGLKHLIGRDLAYQADQHGDCLRDAGYPAHLGIDFHHRLVRTLHQVLDATLPRFREPNAISA